MSDIKTVKAAKDGRPEATNLTFSKEQLLNSERYANQADLVSALLKENETYTFKQVDGLIANYLKGKVK